MLSFTSEALFDDQRGPSHHQRRSKDDDTQNLDSQNSKKLGMAN